MTKTADIVCKNILTGSVSEFGRVRDQRVHQTLISLLDGEEVDRDLYYSKRIENFVFAAYRRANYTDEDGKVRFINYSQTEVDEIIDDIFSFLSSQTREIIDYTHDIQYLIGALNGISVIKPSENRDVDVLLAKFERINLVSILISAKSSFFRYLTEDTGKLKKSDISITGKVFKIFKGVDFLAESRGKKVNAEFNSNSKSTVRMVDIFEFIPYIIVENAIKYGPLDLDVDFSVHEGNSTISVDISSLGPIIEDDEFERIFDRGYRGKKAIATGLSGHGMGLYQAKKGAATLFDGDIVARQTGQLININNTQYRETIFTIRIPK